MVHNYKHTQVWAFPGKTAFIYYIGGVYCFSEKNISNFVPVHAVCHPVYRFYRGWFIAYFFLGITKI